MLFLFHVDLSFQRISFSFSVRTNVSCKMGLLETHPLNFFLSERALISPSLLKANFIEYKILGWYFFSPLNILSISLHYLIFMVSKKSSEFFSLFLYR